MASSATEVFVSYKAEDRARLLPRQAAGVDEVNARCKVSLLDQDGEPVPSRGMDSQTCFTLLG